MFVVSVLCLTDERNNERARSARGGVGGFAPRKSPLRASA